MSDQRFLPSDHERQRKINSEEQKLLEEKQKAEALALRRAVDRVLDSEDGKILWRWIFNRCGWVKPALLYLSDADVVPLRTEALAAIRDVYKDLRSIASPDLRVDAEDFAENGTVKNKKGGK